MDAAWFLEADGYDPADETRRESLFGLGNGVLFLRACAPEAAVDAQGDGCDDPRHYPGLYRAGIYNTAARQVDGRNARITSLVNLPYPLSLSLRLGEDARWLTIDEVQLLHYRQRLDLRHGCAHRDFVFRDPSGRETRVDETRLVSMAQADLILLRWHVTPLNWTGPLHLRSLLPLRARNTKVARNLAYEGQHVHVVRALCASDGQAVRATSTDGRHALCIQVQMLVDGAPAGLRGEGGHGLWQEACCEAGSGQGVAVELRAEVATEDEAARRRVMPCWSHAVSEQGEAWRSLWERVHLEAPGDEELERLCRLNAFHLLQTVSPLSLAIDAGLPARGWQEAYFGHIFWDELFAFPFFSLRLPALARGLLLYRYRRLDAAREAARRAGFEGAMYPWRSATSGAEETPPCQYIPTSGRWKPDCTHLQRHIGAAIAYNLWHHHLATDDRELLLGATGEMLIEIARFWASIARRYRTGGRYEIRGVIGPDEYHDAYPHASVPGLDNNAYTNAMAAWTLRCASELPQRLSGEDWLRLCAKTRLRSSELERWDEVSRQLKLPLLDGDVIAQFEGFEHLRPVDAEPLPRRDRKVREDWWLDAQGESVNDYQVTKQADTLMLCHLLGRAHCEMLVRHLGYRLAPGWYERTVRHHLSHVSHESSLSRIACAGALAEVDLEASWSYFRQALHTDFGPGASASTHEGLHLGAMAGVWDVLQRHYLGLHLEQGLVTLRPHPPAALDDLAMTVCVRGSRLRLHLQGRDLQVTLHPKSTAEFVLRHDGKDCRLRPGDTVALRCR